VRVERTIDIEDANRRFWRPGESPDPLRFRRPVLLLWSL